MQITVTLDAALTQQLIARGLSLDLKPALREAALYEERALKTRIYQEVSANGQPYAPLKPATLARKKSGTILREKSILVNAFQILPVTDDQAQIENPTEYGINLQRGTAKMAARPFMEFSEEDKDRIQAIVEAHMRRRLQP